jgi:hypothetical protein
MAIVSNSIASGAYDATWVIQSTPTSIGLFEGPIRLQQNLNGIPVRASQWGDTIIDYIMRGAGCFGVMVLKEWTTATKAFIWPFGSTMGIVDEPGKKFSDYCTQLVLTAQVNTPAATLGPVTRTYPYVAVLPGHNLDIALVAGMRDIVVAVGILPEPNSSGSRKARFYTDT